MGASAPTAISATLSHMTVVGVRELKQNASAVLALVEAGEVVDVTVRGRLVGRLVPVSASSDPLQRLIDEGLATPPSRSLADIGLPPGPVDPAATLSEALGRMRSDERD